MLFPILYAKMTPDRDEGLFLLMAREIKDGAVLYRDYADNKPPGIFFFLIPVVMLAGTDTLKIRIAAGLVNFVAAAFIFLIGRKLGSWKAGAIAAVAYIMLINGLISVGFLLKTETVANMFVCAGVYALLRAERKHLLYAAAGMLFAFGALVRQNAAYALILAAYLIWKHGESRLGRYALLAGGVFLGVLPFVLYLASNGVLLDMVYYTTYGMSDPDNPNAIGPISIGASVGNLVISVFIGSAFAVFTLLLLASYSGRSDEVNAEKRKFVWLWLALAFTTGAVMPYINQFFVMMVLPPLVLIASIGLLEIGNELRELNSGSVKPLWRYVVPSLIFLALCIMGATYLVSVGHSMSGKILYQPGTMTAGDMGYVKMVIGSEVAAGARFYVAATEPQLYYMLGSKPLTRFPFMSPYAFENGQKQTFDKEIIGRLEEIKPEYVILNDKDVTTLNMIKRTERFGEILEFVDREYVKVGDENGIVIYRRKERLTLPGT